MKRYTVRVSNGTKIKNVFHTDELHKAIQKEDEYKKKYSEVWIADAVLELLVG